MVFGSAFSKMWGRQRNVEGVLNNEDDMSETDSLDSGAGQLTGDAGAPHSYLDPRKIYTNAKKGRLFLCTKGIHAFLVLEYLDAESGSLAFQRMDFGPKSKIYAIIGMGEVKHAEFSSKAGTAEMKKMENVKAGPQWEVDVAIAAAQFKKVKKEYDSGAALDLYSFAGESLQSSSNSLIWSWPGVTKEDEVKLNNCVTFSRNFMMKCREELGLTKEDVECINNWKQWIPVQIPAIVVPTLA